MRRLLSGWPDEPLTTHHEQVEFCVLGPLEVRTGGQAIALPPGRVCVLLTVLLLHANQIVSRSELTDLLWDDPPEDTRATLQTYASRLRAVLGKDRDLIETTPAGYLIAVPTHRLDLSRFRQYVAEAASNDEPVEAARLLTDALALWRGAPLSDGGGRALAVQAAALTDERLDALEQLIEARLKLGEHAQLVQELQTLTRRHPLRERFWAQLMIALHCCSRRADALTTYSDAAKKLADRLGLDPGPELQRVHQAVLASDPRLEHRAPEAASAGWVRLAQLPPDQPIFVGRTKLIATLEQTLRASDGVPVVVLSGLPGAGKSALATKLGHRLAADFPDGQWYVELGRNREPGEVLAELLRASGADPRHLPDATDRRAAELRSRIAGRRVLIVLDDARSTKQIIPLVPGSAGCAVVISSRSQLTGLHAQLGAKVHIVDTFDESESIALLTKVLSQPVVEADLSAARHLSDLCGGLPLALRIAAANLATRPDPDIVRYVAELQDESRLDKLTVPADPDNAVRAAFSLSYNRLTPDGQRCFRLLGSVVGIDFTANTTAALLNVDQGCASALLEELAAGNLLHRRAMRRYQFHDLLQLYAAELVANDADRSAAVRRLFDRAIRTAHATTRFSIFRPLQIDLLPGEEVAFDDAGAATAWLDTERSNLVAMVEHAAAHGLPAYACQLADLINDYLHDQVLLPELRRSAEAALIAAQETNQPIAEALAHLSLGYCRYFADDAKGELQHSRQALVLARTSGSEAGKARVLVSVSAAEMFAGRLDHAAALLTECLTIADQLDLASVRSAALVNLAEIANQQARPEDALYYAGLALQPGRCVPRYELSHLVNRVEAHRLRGDLAAAQNDLTRARAIHHADGPPRPAAWIATVAAQLAADLGDTDEALRQARTAIRLTEQLNDPFEASHAHHVLGSVLLRDKQLTPATAQFEIAQRLATSAGFRGRLANATFGLATVAAASGNVNKASELATQAQAIAAELGLHALEQQADRLRISCN